jgi:hypothetical protein
LGLVACPIPGCNGRWGSAHVLEDSRQNILVEKAVSVKVEAQNSSVIAESLSTIAEEDTTSISVWWPTPRYFKNSNPGNKNHPEDRSNQWIQLQIPDCRMFCRFPITGYTEPIGTGNILVLSETFDRPSYKNLRIYIQDKTTMHLTKRIYIERFLRTSIYEIQFNGYVTPYRAVRLDSEPNYDKHKQWYRNIDYPFSLQFTKVQVNIFTEENQAHPPYRSFYTLLHLLQSLSEN